MAGCDAQAGLAELTRATLECGEEMDKNLLKWSKHFLTTIPSLYNAKEEQRAGILYEQVGTEDLRALVQQIELAVAQEVRYENIQVEPANPKVSGPSPQRFASHCGPEMSRRHCASPAVLIRISPPFLTGHQRTGKPPGLHGIFTQDECQRPPAHEGESKHVCW